MTIEGRSRPQRIRLFQDERLERLTLISPRVFVVIWGIVLAVALWASWGVASLPVSIALVLLGVIVWTLFEYVMHRFIFHLNLKSELGKWLIFLMHGNHHVEPGDRYRNIMPPIVSVWLAGAVWLAFVMVLGPVGSLIFLGFAIGYVAYDSIHYACHQFPMRGPVLRQLRRHHIRHHYARREGNYAITAIFWDRLFRTEVPVKGR